MSERTKSNILIISGIIVATIAGVSLLVVGPHTRKTPEPDNITATDIIAARTSEAAIIDPAIESAWNRAAVLRGLTPADYEAVYLQDERTYTVLLLPDGSGEGDDNIVNDGIMNDSAADDIVANDDGAHDAVSSGKTVHADTAPTPLYEITIERNSHRVLSFETVR